MDLRLDKILFVKTSSSTGYSLPVSFLKSQWSRKSNWKDRVLQHYITSSHYDKLFHLQGGIRISTYLRMVKFPLRELVTSPIPKDRAGKHSPLHGCYDRTGCVNLHRQNLHHDLQK